MNMLLKRKQGLFRNRQPKAFLIRFARTVKSNCSDSRRVVPQQMEMDGFLNLWIIKPGPANKMIIKKGIEFTITEGQTDQTIKKNQWRKKIKACCWVLTQLRTKKVCCVRKKKLLRAQQKLLLTKNPAVYAKKHNCVRRLQQSWSGHLHKQQVETETGQLLLAQFRHRNLCHPWFLLRLERILGLVGHGAGARQAR